MCGSWRRSWGGPSGRPPWPPGTPHASKTGLPSHPVCIHRQTLLDERLKKERNRAAHAHPKTSSVHHKTGRASKASLDCTFKKTPKTKKEHEIAKADILFFFFCALLRGAAKECIGCLSVHKKTKNKRRKRIRRKGQQNTTGYLQYCNSAQYKTLCLSVCLCVCHYAIILCLSVCVCICL